MTRILGKFFCLFIFFLCAGLFGDIFCTQAPEKSSNHEEFQKSTTKKEALGSEPLEKQKIETHDELFMRVFGKKRVLTDVPMTFSLSIDGESVGSVFAIFSDKNKKILAVDLKKILPEFLEDQHIDRIHSAKDQDGFISFRELEKIGCEVSAQINQMNIDITLPSTLKKERILNENRHNRDFSGCYLDPATFSGCITVRASATFNNQLNDLKNFLLIPNINIGGLNFEGQASANKVGDQKNTYRRDLSSMVYDWREKCMRITGGDVISASSDYQDVPRIFGVGLNKYRHRYSSARSRDVPVTILRKSTVRVYANGVLTREKTLFPGSYIFDDLPMAYGSNDVRMEIIDDTGKKEEITYGHYRDDSILSVGETEFGITYGSPENFNQNDEHDRGRYSKNKVLSTFLKVGTIPAVESTIGFQKNNIGILKNYGLKYSMFLGTIDSFYATSIQRDNSLIIRGNAKKISFTTKSVHLFDTASLYGRIMFEKMDNLFTPYVGTTNYLFYNMTNALNNSYANSINPNNFNVPSGGRTSITYNAGLSVGGVNLNLMQKSDKFTDGQRQITQNLYVYRNFNVDMGSTVQSVNVMLSFGRSSGMINDKSIGISMTFNIGSGYSATTSVDKMKSVSLRRDNSKDGLGFEANASRGSDSQNTMGSLRYDHQRFQANVENTSSKTSVGSSNSTTVGAETSLYFADGYYGVYRERLNSNGFLLVNPTKALGDQEIELKGKNSSSGMLGGAVSSVSYDQENMTEIDMEKLPIGYDIDPCVIHTKGEYKRGIVAHIKGGGQYMALGKLVYMNGKPVALASGHAIHMHDKDADRIPFFSNSEGKIYISGLKEGKYKAYLNLGGSHDFYIDVERKKLSEYGELDLGEIECGEEIVDEDE